MNCVSDDTDTLSSVTVTDDNIDDMHDQMMNKCQATPKTTEHIK